MKKEISLEKLAQMIAKGFEQVDKRFEQVDKKFKQIDKRLGGIEVRLNGLEIDVRELRKNQLEYVHWLELRGLEKRVSRLEAKS